MVDPSHLERTLVVRTDRLGDVILTLPLVRAIHARAPRARVTMLVRTAYADLLRGQEGIDDVIDVVEERALPLRVDVVRTRRFTCAFLPSPSLLQARFARGAGIPVRVGTAYRWYSRLFTERVREHRHDARRNEAVYNVRMLGTDDPIDPQRFPARLAIDTQSALRVGTWLAEQRIDPDRLLIVHPGSGGSARDLPPERFGRVAALLERDGFVPVLTGTAPEQRHAREAMGEADRRWTQFIDQPLPDVAALLARARCVVSNSTGILHLAAAVGTPVVGLYPPIVACSPTRWGPWADHAATIVPEVGMTCRKCRGPACEFYDCMRLIRTEEIVARVHALVAQTVAEGARA